MVGRVVAQNDGSVETWGLTEEEFAVLVARPEVRAMKSPAVFVLNINQAEQASSKMKAAKKSFIEDTIDNAVKYDVIIQVGHFPRIRGATGSEGTYIAEQDGTAYVATQIRGLLSETDYKFAVIGADAYKTGEKIDAQHFFRTKLFISLHLDGSSTPCASSASLGYNPAFGRDQMQLFGVGLAIALGLNAREFMDDNFTPNLSHFYSYRHSNSELAEGIVEMGELSCPEQEIKFLVGADQIAANLFTAIGFALKE